MKRQTILSSFGNAFNGLFYFIAAERNGKIQLTAAVIVSAAGFYFQISGHEWIAILLCTGSVLSLEMLNSALEKLCDLVEPGYSPVIKVVKDVSAAAVLFSSIISVIIALIIFLPKI